MSRKKQQVRPARAAATPHAQRTADSFANFQARLGWGADNQASASQYTLTYQSRNRVWLEAAYRGSWIVRAAVDAIPEDMTRKGIEMSGLDPTDVSKMETALTRKAIWDQLCDTGKWAQLYGGAIAVMLIDGQDMSQPLRRETIGKGQFKGLLVLDRWMVAPPVGEVVTEFGPDLGMPKYYDVLPSTIGLPQGRIHHSRVLRMDGEALPFYQRISENGWGLSILEPMWDRLIAFDSATVGAGQLVYKAHLRTLSVEKLREIIAMGGPALNGLLKQVEMIRLGQSNEGITLIDATDKFETHQYAFSGL
ncbi:phage portal protein, partial [Burkholderia sp. BDU5]|uniref:phage portal protein n=1 Tax=Burkholderia sp. BDU5 TaxID=1385590 RepID=UPI0012E363C1